MDTIYALFLYSSLDILRSVNVVFDFNASLIDVAPVSPMLLPVYSMRIEELIVYRFNLCVVSFVFTTQIELRECCV